MKRKALLITGLTIGYILGARAGRERYDAIASRARQFWENPRVSRARDDAARYARQQAPVVRARAEAVARATPGALVDGARATAGVAKDVAKDVADRTATAAKDVADRTSTAAKDARSKTSTAAKDVRDRTATIAKDVSDRTTAAARDAATRVGEARDNALADLDDLGDLGDEHEIDEKQNS
jgi:gas vesicle protein